MIFLAIILLLMEFGYAVDESSSPGLAMDYKVHIDAGKEDCYYQYVTKGSSVYASVTVLKGGDGKIGFTVYNHMGTVVKPQIIETHGEFEEDASFDGYYGICIDNSFSRMSAKLVNLYITTFSNEAWNKYEDEIKQYEINAENFTNTFAAVDTRIKVMQQLQGLSRAWEDRDYQLLLQNNSWVQLWSLGLCLALVICSVGQVVAVRGMLSDAYLARGKASVGA